MWAGLLLVLLLGTATSTRADVAVPVVLHEGLRQVAIVDADGVPFEVSGNGAMPRVFEPGLRPIRVQGRPYRGAIEVRRASGGRLRVLNHVGLEDYLRGVVPSEMPAHWPGEALKAQAVAARTYALYRIQRAREEGVAGELSADVLDQVYRGVRAETPPADAAIRATRGEALAVDQRWLVAYFHSSCGGISERPSAVWGVTEARRRDATWMAADARVFAQRPDPACAESPWSNWRSTVTRARATSALRRLSGMTRVDRLEVVSRTSSGRVDRFLVVGRRGRVEHRRTLSGQAVRMALGPNTVRSLSCTVETTGSGFLFRGAGWGHGVGLCQWGARGRALAGDDYRTILAAYYPGAWLAHTGVEPADATAAGAGSVTGGGSRVVFPASVE